ncbi:MAG: hypothetical protein ACF8PN_05325 [Phycisphaerales bacterium]
MKKIKTLFGGVAALGVAALLGGMQVEPVAVNEGMDGPGRDDDGPDMKFCQLYDLEQYGRVGDIVGLSIATTSWNVGNRDLMWFASPDNRHPFIVGNMYRLKNDRFEQIGQSWIKHGFYALGNTQCGGQCIYEPGHYTGDWLGQNCTDTYSSSLNASQSGLGPRYEVNPWTGEWNYQGSVFQRGVRAEDAVDRRIQVHDDDLDPALNQGAQYFGEGYYVILDDINVMNSASWKPVTPNGQPGGWWNFSMSGSGTRPNDGFAIDAWTGARQTMIAQELPVIEFVSPDGRAIIAAKANDLGGGAWHYEYAVLNIDMDRKISSFSIPLPDGVDVANIGFHAVEHRNEPDYTNEQWDATVESGAITWSTDSNPIRWGTLYNFRFNANRGPGDVVATAGLYEPGAPTSVSGVTWGPAGGYDLDMTVSGTCPGTVTVTVSGGAPGTQVALAYANNLGSQAIPPGLPCGGTVLDLDHTARQVGTPRTFDANGEAVFTGPAPQSVCGGFLQAVGVDGCLLSNPALLQ